MSLRAAQLTARAAPLAVIIVSTGIAWAVSAADRGDAAGGRPAAAAPRC